MSKVKFTLRVEAELLKEMKIFAIQRSMPLNELLVMCYTNHKARYERMIKGEIMPFEIDLNDNEFILNSDKIDESDIPF